MQSILIYDNFLINISIYSIYSNINIYYQHLLAQILCNPPQESCWMGECHECSDTKELEQRLLEIFEKLDVDEITYKQWESTDRTELVNVIQCTEEFVRTLIEKLKVLRTHDFINMMQTKNFYKMKNTLPSGTALVVGDFSENYSFVVQDAAQGVHWSNSSCTLHPWMCYFAENGVLKTHFVLFISDCLTHDTVAVYAFQKVLISLLKEKITNLAAIHYFSDGCARQYKNKKTFLILRTMK